MFIKTGQTEKSDPEGIEQHTRAYKSKWFQNYKLSRMFDTFGVAVYVSIFRYKPLIPFVWLLAREPVDRQASTTTRRTESTRDFVAL